MKKIIPIVIVAIIIVGLAFFAGMRIGKGKNTTALTMQQRFAQDGTGNFRGGTGTRNGAGNFAGGQIIAKDDKSITVQIQGGGSKIIFYSATTEIGKTVTGTTADLEIGKTVTATGTTNSDGSITAQSIQLRPQSLVPPTP
jgi:hypothetical protein